MRAIACIVALLLAGCASHSPRNHTVADEAADIEVVEALPLIQHDMALMREALEQMNASMQAIHALMIIGQKRDAKYHHNHMERHDD